MTELIPNPYGGAPTNGRGGVPRALASTDQQRAIAEVQAAMLLARANPRNPKDAVDRILNHCARPSLASNATYDYARGGTAITGPNIRLAEVIAQGWGNLHYGVRELEQTETDSTVQTYCWDLESNVRREMTFQVPRAFKSKGVLKTLEDPRDVYENMANMAARRLRACILAVVPGDVVEAAVEQCERTLKTNVDTSADAQKKLLKFFADYGVTREAIELRLQRSIERILPAQMVSMKKIANSLMDGMSSPGDWFALAKPEEGAEKGEGKPAAPARRRQRGAAALQAELESAAPAPDADEQRDEAQEAPPEAREDREPGEDG